MFADIRRSRHGGSRRRLRRRQRNLPAAGRPFHADVDFDHDWIVSEAAGDLAPIQCSTLPTALGPGTATAVDDDSMTSERWRRALPDRRRGRLHRDPLHHQWRARPAAELRPVGESRQPTRDPRRLRLRLDRRHLTRRLHHSRRPAAGDYYVLVDNSTGSSGEFQLTVTGFGAPVPTWTPTISLTPSITPTPSRTPTPSSTPSPA